VDDVFYLWKNLIMINLPHLGFVALLKDMMIWRSISPTLAQAVQQRFLLLLGHSSFMRNFRA